MEGVAALDTSLSAPNRWVLVPPGPGAWFYERCPPGDGSGGDMGGWGVVSGWETESSGRMEINGLGIHVVSAAWEWRRCTSEGKNNAQR